MSNNQMLQILIDGQASIKEEMKKGFKEVNEKIDKVDARVTKLGLSLARLEDDAPTIKSHNNLKKRVKKLEVVDGAQ